MNKFKMICMATWAKTTEHVVDTPQRVKRVAIDSKDEVVATAKKPVVHLRTAGAATKAILGGNPMNLAKGGLTFKQFCAIQALDAAALGYATIALPLSVLEMGRKVVVGVVRTVSSIVLSEDYASGVGSVVGSGIAAAAVAAAVIATPAVAAAAVAATVVSATPAGWFAAAAVPASIGASVVATAVATAATVATTVVPVIGAVFNGMCAIRGVASTGLLGITVLCDAGDLVSGGRVSPLVETAFEAVVKFVLSPITWFMRKIDEATTPAEADFHAEFSAEFNQQATC